MHYTGTKLRLKGLQTRGTSSGDICEVKLAKTRDIKKDRNQVNIAFGVSEGICLRKIKGVKKDE